MMGKVKKMKAYSGRTEVDSDGRNVYLADQILQDKTVQSQTRTKEKKKKDFEVEFVDEKLSKKILEQARIQQEELEDVHGVQRTKSQQKKTVSLGRKSGGDESQSEDEDEDLSEDEKVYESVDVKEEDETALHAFMSTNPATRRTLADIILEKITEKQTEIQTQMSDVASVQVQKLDDRVVKMYRSIGGILQKYRSGKLPKAFKIIPSLRNWEQILYITEPDRWSAAAMYQSSRIFASNLNAKMAQRFFNLVLMPRIRDDIAEYKRLNFHLYMAVRKSLFKPAAFFKGVLLPMCESGNCTLREATIVASILEKNSIPMLHSAAAILKIAEMDYTGASSIFLKTLLDKKYALPYRVIDAIVHHFLRFVNDKREMPVLWHQCFLTFVQRYKEDISSEQKAALMELLRAHNHEFMTEEIRRELVHSKCRDTEVGEMENQ